MRTNKRFIFTVAIIGVWTILTYFIIIRNHSEYQSGKAKFREKIENLEKEVEEESKTRDQIVQQYNNIIQILKSKTTTATPVVQDGSLVAVGEEEKIVVFNDKIDFNGKYIGGDINKPVIPVIVFACNRVSVKQNLDALVKHRPSREQFPIIVSQVRVIKSLTWMINFNIDSPFS